MENQAAAKHERPHLLSVLDCGAFDAHLSSCLPFFVWAGREGAGVTPSGSVSERGRNRGGSGTVAPACQNLVASIQIFTGAT